MTTERESEQIRLLSDTELYEQAVAFMHSIGKKLPPTQINGLLNVSLANTYEQLQEFVQRQYQRTSWPREAQHVKDFYFRLVQKLKSIEAYVPSVTRYRQEKLTREDEQAIKMLLAREFIQHLLAENAYMEFQRTFDNRNQERPQGANRGPSTRQERRQ